MPDPSSLGSKALALLMYPFTKSPSQGAETSIFLASSPDVEGVSGKYFVDCKPVAASSQAYDAEVSQRCLPRLATPVPLSRLAFATPALYHPDHCGSHSHAIVSSNPRAPGPGEPRATCFSTPALCSWILNSCWWGFAPLQAASRLWEISEELTSAKAVMTV